MGDYELSGFEQVQFKLPAMDDVSEIDHLNEAFINEHSIFVPGSVVARDSEFSEVKA